ncbi:hypothetical protein GCM10020000_22840 [Streptomyces olivoverticillatus]
MLQTLSALRPMPLTRNVQATKTNSVITISTVLLFTPKSRSSTVSTAYAPVTALIVSQPNRATQRIAPGKRFPRTPNVARESIAPGAPPHLPDTDRMPTRPKETTAAQAATTSACQKFRWLKTTSAAPMVSNSTLMLAATQVGKSSRTRPCRS